MWVSFSLHPTILKLRESDEQESEKEREHKTLTYATGGRGRRSGNIAEMVDRYQGSATRHNHHRLNHWTTRHGLLLYRVTWTFTAEWAGCWFGVDTTPTLTWHTVDSTPPDTRMRLPTWHRQRQRRPTAQRRTLWVGTWDSPWTAKKSSDGRVVAWRG